MSDHCGWAVLVTVSGDAAVVDRRRVELVDPGLPSLPHHQECQVLPVDDAVALVGCVRRSAERRAVAALAALAADVSARITGIAIRACPPLPATVAERIASYRAQNVADTVMYREALVRAAKARDWPVYFYEVKHVRTADAVVSAPRAVLGPPWTKDHRLAMAAAIAYVRRS